MTRYECSCGRDFATSGGRATHQRSCATHQAGTVGQDSLAGDASMIVDTAPATRQETATGRLRGLINDLENGTLTVHDTPAHYWTTADASVSRDLTRLDLLQEVIDAARLEQHATAQRLRESRSGWQEKRATWDAIGAAVGISKQLASQRFAAEKAPRARVKDD